MPTPTSTTYQLGIETLAFTSKNVFARDTLLVAALLLGCKVFLGVLLYRTVKGCR